jgi:hypothetical protein
MALSMKVASSIQALLLCIIISSCSNFTDKYQSNNVITPSGSFAINSGSYYLSQITGTTRSVALNIAISNADQMCFSNDGSAWSAYEPYSSSKTWTIDNSHEVKTVYGKFIKNDGGTTVLSDIITPLVEKKIVATDAASNSYWGGSLWGYSLSNLVLTHDGNRLLVGHTYASANNIDVFNKDSSGNWNQSILTGPSGSISFGSSIAVTPDGSRLIVGDLDLPAVYLYSWNGSSYTLSSTQPVLPPGVSTNDYAVTVSISDDGNNFVVGSYRNFNDAAFLFAINGSNWPNFEKKFEASDAVNGDFYGLGVKISGNGNTIIISAPLQLSNKGVLYIYRRNGSNWDEKKISTVSGNQDYFGRHLSITPDGNRFIAGSRILTYGNTLPGAAYLFDWNGTTWVETKRFEATDETGIDDKFGYGVAMSDDGNSVVIGSPRAQSATLMGKSYVYRFNGSSWDVQRISASDGHAGNFYGNITAISGDGSTIAIAASYDNNGGLNANRGAVYLYY